MTGRVLAATAYDFLKLRLEPRYTTISTTHLRISPTCFVHMVACAAATVDRERRRPQRSVQMIKAFSVETESGSYPFTVFLGNMLDRFLFGCFQPFDTCVKKGILKFRDEKVRHYIKHLCSPIVWNCWLWRALHRPLACWFPNINRGTGIAMRALKSWGQSAIIT